MSMTEDWGMAAPQRAVKAPDSPMVEALNRIADALYANAQATMALAEATADQYAEDSPEPEGGLRSMSERR